MKKILTIFLSVFLQFVVTSCGKNESDNPSVKEEEPLFKEVIFDTINDDYIYEGTKTVSPYKAYNADGSLIGENIYMSYAIRTAAMNATNTNRCYVLDGNGLKIFERDSKSKYYCFDGNNYVGVKNRNEAIEWCKAHSKGFIIDGNGSGYQGMGTIYFDGSDLSQPINLELFAGSYNYMYSTRGTFQSDKVVENGFGYIECTLKLSLASYKPTEDDSKWNAFVFLHGNANEMADFGLKGVIEDGEMVWKPFRLCSHTSHKEDGLKWFEETKENAITKMKYDEQLDCYTGADDIFMQFWQGKDGWKMIFTNLTTGQKYELSEYHTDMMKDQHPYYQFLVAASYCPAIQDVWNYNCGAALRNVCYTDIKVARYNSDEVYDNSVLQDFYPDSNMGYGFTQGAGCASMIYGINQDGKKMISFSTYYDGGSHFR